MFLKKNIMYHTAAGASGRSFRQRLVCMPTA